MKKSLLMALCIALAAALSIGGTMAYLQDSDSDVNVMTLGNVNIEQIELQRKEQSAENNADNLEDFKDDKPLFPSVYDDMGWDEDWQDWGTGGSNALFADNMKNVVDKFVFVENTGKSPAYVRTWFAFEQGDLTEVEFEALVGQNINDSHWEWETVASNVEIQGGKYLIKVATYQGNAGENNDVHPDGKLPAGETTRPSLLQVMLYKHAGNEDVAALDSNGDNLYNILAVSQAIQTEGFDSAEAALTEGFGAATVENHPFGEIKFPGYIYSLADLKSAVANGGEFKLATDLIADAENTEGMYLFSDAWRVLARVTKDFTIDLNGYDLEFNFTSTQDDNSAIFYVDPNVTFNIVDSAEEDGTISVNGDHMVVWSWHDSIVNVHGGNFVSNSATADIADSIDPLFYTCGPNSETGIKIGEIHIYGGTYTFQNSDTGINGGFNVNDNRGGLIVLYEGVLLSNSEFRQPTEGEAARIMLAEGCVLQEVVIDGTTWYQVVKE